MMEKGERERWRGMVSNGGRRKVGIIGTNLERCPLGSVSEFYLGKLGKGLVCRNET